MKISKALGDKTNSQQYSKVHSLTVWIQTPSHSTLVHEALLPVMGRGLISAEGSVLLPGADVHSMVRVSVQDPSASLLDAIDALPSVNLVLLRELQFRSKWGERKDFSNAFRCYEFEGAVRRDVTTLHAIVKHLQLGEIEGLLAITHGDSEPARDGAERVPEVGLPAVSISQCVGVAVGMEFGGLTVCGIASSPLGWTWTRTKA